MTKLFFDLDSQAGRQILVWPVPFEETVSFGGGTRLGPETIIATSRQIETYEPELDIDLEDIVHFTVLPEVPCSGISPEELQASMKEVLRGFNPRTDFFLLLGGEHSISLPLFEFYKSAQPDMVILQIDAHADLRDTYQGSGFSHACIMRRARDLKIAVAQVGIRSLSREEMTYIQNQPDNELLYIPAYNLPSPQSTADEVLKFLNRRPVYLTFDVDGLDPSILPGTGTPEPGGLEYGWLNAFFQTLLPRVALLGMDICELSPVPGMGQVSESVATVCIRNILTSYFKYHD